MMSSVDFDYDTFLGANNTTSPTTTENDSDSGIAYTPPMPTGLDDTVIDLDGLGIFPLNMESPLSDDPNDDFNRFSAELFENPYILGDNSTFESLFSDCDDLFGEQNQEPSQEIPSPQLPILLPKPSEIPSINNCIKLQSSSNAASIGPKCIKLESINPNPNITIIKTSKPITLTNVPIITMPVTSPSAKRRRSDSPTNHQQLFEMPTLTLDQLKLQYGHMSDEALKKHLRMIKNRESASLSRKRRKDLMENLDTKVKDLTDANEQLKKTNSNLLTRIHKLEVENALLKQYADNNNTKSSQPRKPFILMGIVLFVAFNIFTLKSFAPVSNNLSDSIALYSNEGAVVPSRAILSNRRSNNEDPYIANNEHDYGPNGNVPNYPFIQCVAYINKTHSRRINQDLHSWVQDNYEKQQDTKPVVIPDSKSLTIPSNSVVSTTADSSAISAQHRSRKVARQTKIQSESKGQLQPYKTHEANYDDFIHTIDRKNDTLYFVSFKRDHLILPAREQNQTHRPKMSLILPASMANLNKSIHVPTNHVPMIKIDCEVEDTKLVFVQSSHIPLSYRNDLFQYYSSIPQASI